MSGVSNVDSSRPLLLPIRQILYLDENASGADVKFF
jgi:hypothetical protein